MSQEASRSSSHETDAVESVGIAKQLQTMRDMKTVRLKTPVKTALHQAVRDGRLHQARLLSACVPNIDIKVK